MPLRACLGKATAKFPEETAEFGPVPRRKSGNFPVIRGVIREFQGNPTMGRCQSSARGQQLARELLSYCLGWDVEVESRKGRAPRGKLNGNCRRRPESSA